MKKLIETIKNIWKIEDLKTRIINTLLLLVVYRVGTFVVLPGIDPNKLSELASQASQGVLGLVNIFAGGAFSRASIFALGIMPYISASIVIQLLSIAVPTFQKMQKDGEEGRRKINQITRILTIAITAVQGIGYLINLQSQSPGAIDSYSAWWIFSSIVVLSGGTLFTMWLGEKITDKGLGNGISLIIMVGIISRLPFGLYEELTGRLDGAGGLVFFLLEVAVWLAVIGAVVALVQGTRKIPVNYAKRIVGNRMYQGGRNYLPLKVNSAGVMPIIFAQALMFIPSSIASFFPDSNGSFLTAFIDYTSWAYNLTFAILIIAFTYFYTAIQFNSTQIADELKKQNGFIPGIKPGKKTAEFIDNILSRITLPGSIFLAFVAIFPSLAVAIGINNQFADFYGGTSLLILVGVVLDTLQQVESHLLMRHYDGLMKTGRIKGRTSMPTTSV